jgi:hypothetical protein
MKRLLTLLIFLCLCGYSYGQMLTGIVGGGASAPSCTSVTVDDYQPINTGFLASLPTGIWSTVNTDGKLTESTSGEKATVRCFTTSGSGSPDTSTVGLAYNQSGGKVNYIEATLPAAKDTLLVAFWYFVPALTTGNDHYFLQLWNGSSSASYVRYHGTTGIIMTANGSTTAIAVTAGQWYWISVYYNKNGTSYIYVWDTTGAAVANQSVSSGITSLTTVRIGGVLGPDSQTITSYFDDPVMIWTATVPTSLAP